LHAHNIWWLAFGKDAPAVSDLWRLGTPLLSYRSLGLLLFLAATALVLWRFRVELRQTPQAPSAAVYEACALELLAFYLFPTQMHECYIVPALVFLAAAAITHRRAAVCYGLYSLATLLSLATTLHYVYPHALGPLAALFPAQRQDAMLVSVLLVGLFPVLLWLGGDGPFRRRSAMLVCGLALLQVLILWSPGPRVQRLSDWEPVSSRQDWGRPIRNYSVDGHRLSIGGLVFREGFGSHANSQLSFHLHKAFRRFETAFGLDDEVYRGQKIRFRILVDGVVRFDSGAFSGYRVPGYARVDVASAETLTLEILDGGDGINGDHGDWVHPVLFR
jgi:hypothetical protein